MIGLWSKRDFRIKKFTSKSSYLVGKIGCLRRHEWTHSLHNLPQAIKNICVTLPDKIFEKGRTDGRTLRANAPSLSLSPPYLYSCKVAPRPPCFILAKLNYRKDTEHL